MIEAQDESLISRQVREPGLPVMLDKGMHLLFLKVAVEMRKEPDGHEFLVSKTRLAIVTGALKTSPRRRIVSVTDEQIKVNQEIFHSKKILLIHLFACLFNY